MCQLIEPATIITSRELQAAVTTKILEQEDAFSLDNILELASNLAISIAGYENEQYRRKCISAMIQKTLKSLIEANRVCKIKNDSFYYID